MTRGRFFLICLVGRFLVVGNCIVVVCVSIIFTAVLGAGIIFIIAGALETHWLSVIFPFELGSPLLAFTTLACTILTHECGHWWFVVLAPTLVFVQPDVRILTCRFTAR